MRSWTTPHINTAYRSVAVHAKSEDPGTATFYHLQHHASGRAASSAVANYVYGRDRVPHGHPIINSRPDESTSVALTAANLEIPVPVTRLVMRIDTNVVA